MAIVIGKKVRPWLPKLNFSTLHCKSCCPSVTVQHLIRIDAYIIFAGIFSFIIIYPYGNMAAVDAYFFGASGSTESGLNTVDVKQMKTYQQLVVYFIPIITQMGFINIVVIEVRLHWFEKRLKEIGTATISRSRFSRTLMHAQHLRY